MSDFIHRHGDAAACQRMPHARAQGTVAGAWAFVEALPGSTEASAELEFLAAKPSHFQRPDVSARAGFMLRAMSWLLHEDARRRLTPCRQPATRPRRFRWHAFFFAETFR